MITAITPTSDRTLCFALLQLWVLRQTLKPDQWIVIDDGEVPAVPKLKFITYIRRGKKPNEPKITQRLNLLEGLPLIQGDIIFFLEDDDYYAPNYIKSMIEHLGDKAAVGICKARYYHIKKLAYLRHNNISHASLGSTAIRSYLLPQLRKAIEDERDHIDMNLWPKIKENSVLFTDDEQVLHCSFKGMPGKPGIGLAHESDYYFSSGGRDPELKTLIEWSDPLYVKLVKETLTVEEIERLINDSRI